MKPKRKTTAEIEAQRKAAHAQGRTDGLWDALLLLGVGMGVGLANVLSSPRTGKCPKRSLVFGACRLDENHDGSCDFVGMLK